MLQSIVLVHLVTFMNNSVRSMFFVMCGLCVHWLHGQLITGQRICGKPETKIFPGLWGLCVLDMPSTTSQTVYTLTWPSDDYKEFQGQSEVKTSGLSYFFPKASPWEYPWLSRILR